MAVHREARESPGRGRHPVHLWRIEWPADALPALARGIEGAEHSRLVASSIWNKPERFSRVKDVILQGLAAGHLKPAISRTFPLNQIVEAHRHLESNQQVGKFIVTV
jgi:NADPH:quinone reductase-like Zn-dependent oxidoreductase